MASPLVTVLSILVAIAASAHAESSDAEANATLNKPATIIEGTINGVSLSTLTDGEFLPQGTFWQSGTVWWNGADPLLEVDLLGKYVISGLIVQADDNDTYMLSYLDEGSVWHDLWHIPLASNGGMQTRPNPSNNRQQLAVEPPIIATKLRIKANSGDGLHSVSEVQAFGSRAPCEPDWHPVVAGESSGVNGAVLALAEWNGDLVAAGSFTTAGGQVVNHIARWDGAAWHPFISAGHTGVDAPVHALTVLNGDLVAGGLFITAGGQPVNHVARWDGLGWHPFTFGDHTGVNDYVSGLTIWNGDLIAGGAFTTAGGQVVNRIARCDRDGWHPLTSGGQIGVGGSPNASVRGLTEWNGDLIVGGFFTTAGGQTVNRIARWNGTAWDPLGTGVSGANPNGFLQVNSVLAFDDGEGSGTALYVGGIFLSAGGINVNHIARWDGTEWAPLGSGVGGNVVWGLAAFDDGTGAGPALYVCGNFSSAGGINAKGIARWEENTWASLGSGTEGPVVAMSEVRGASRSSSALYVGGQFTMAGSAEAANIARWQGCPVDADYLGVFYTDFETGLPPQISQAGSLQSTQGYASLGSPENQFATTFLRNSTGGNPASVTKLTLSDLPPHDAISLRFLLALIDSWDGLGDACGGCCGPDILNVRMDGQLIFSHSLSNGSQSCQTYLPPPGGSLHGTFGPTSGQLGFNGAYWDAAYDLGVEPSLHAIPHTDSSLVIEFFASGAGWQAGDDESWAIDNLEVLVRPTTRRQLPDLEVASVSSGRFGIAGQQFEVSWSVGNGGDAMSQGPWTDRVYISSEPSFSAAANPLGPPITIPESLDPGDSYARTGQFVYPTVAGTYWIFVVTDADDNVREGPGESNNIRVSDAPVVVTYPPTPDLRSMLVSVQPTGVVGTSVPVSWTTTNEGDIATSGSWVDGVYVSVDELLDSSDTLVKTVAPPTTLNPGDSYSQTTSIPLPTVAGTYWVIVQADQANAVFEARGEGNNASASESPIVVESAPKPDLVAEVLTAPASAYADESVAVTWRVTNGGYAPANGVWFDAVYVSTDDAIGNDQQVWSGAHASGLAESGSYERTATFAVPGTLEGPVYFYVVTDLAGAVEEITDSNNTGFAVSATIVAQPPRPNFVVASIDRVAGGLVGEPFEVTYTVLNVTRTPSPLGVVWTDRISAVSVETGQKVTLSDAFVTQQVEGGESYSVTRTAAYPIAAGSYRIEVQVDRTNSVNEGLEGGEADNVEMSDSIFLAEHYVITASTPLESGTSPAPVTISGSAMLKGSGRTIGNVPVAVAVDLQGTTRVLQSSTDRNGQYSVEFNALPGEAGAYSVRAGPPGAVGAAVQDTFVLYALSASPSLASVTITPGAAPVQGTLTAINPGDVPMTGLSVGFQGAPEGLSFTLLVPDDSFDPSQSIPIAWTMSASGSAFGTYPIAVHLFTAEGAEATATFQVTIKPADAVLAATPASLNAIMPVPFSMSESVQTLVSFSVTNVGAGTAEDVKVFAPTSPAWINLATPASLGDLETDESATVVMQLNPPANTALGPYAGVVQIVAANESHTVPFTFNAVSTVDANLTVTVTDEFSYWDEANGFPKVAGATVEVTEHYTGTIVGSEITGENGVVTFETLTVGWYDLKVTAPNHGVFGTTTLLSGDGPNALEAFLPNEVVSYVWTVVPTEIVDQYQITIAATFQTYVPAPVITINPPLIDLSTATEEYTQVDLEIRNWGLISAQAAELVVGTHPRWEIIPLITDIGDIPGVAQGAVPVPIVIPVLIRDTQFGQNVAGGAQNCLPITLYLKWQLLCGIPIPYIASVAIKQPESDCPLLPLLVLPPTNPVDPIGPYDPPEPWVVAPQPVVQPVNCNPQALKCLLSAASCALSFTPFGPLLTCPLDVLNNCIDPSAQTVTPEHVFDCYVEGPVLICTDLKKWVPLYRATECACNLIQNCFPLLDDNYVPDYIQCILPYLPCSKNSLYDAVEKLITDPGCGGPGGVAGDDLFAADPELEYFRTHYERVLSFYSLLVHPFGKAVWLDTEEEELPLFEAWLTEALAAVKSNSDFGANISPTERLFLQMYPRPSHLSLADVDFLLNRWDNTVTYWQQGWTTKSQLPPEADDNFIDQAVLSQKRAVAMAARAANQAEGYEGFFDGMQSALELLIAAKTDATEGICATVKIEISQQAVLTRSAVEATLELTNNGSSPIEQIGIDLVIKDASGQIATALFEIPSPQLVNLTDVAGTGALPAFAPNNIGSATWIIVPTDAAAPTGPTLYSVSGTLTYAIDGELASIPLFPVPVIVQPDPSLLLNYYLETVVYGNDPFTPTVEPPVPFSLGLLVHNKGPGDAMHLSIASAQPEVIENDQGLIIDFQIIGTSVQGEPQTPSLTVDFGDLPPHETKVAQWLLTSSLQGEFIGYSATFVNTNGLGGAGLSLIDDVDIYGMTHVVRAVVPDDDGLPDFLVNETPDLEDLPDALHRSEYLFEPVTAVTSGSVTIGPEPLQATMSVAMHEGWNYLRLDDPFANQLKLAQVLRSDGSSVMVGPNAWQTSRILHPIGGMDTPQHRIHIFDSSERSSGVYTLVYDPDLVAPSITGWFSVATHGSLGEVPLAVPTGSAFSDPRQSGISTLEVQLTESVLASTFTPRSVQVEGATANGTVVDLSAITTTVQLLSDGSRARIGFTPVLPDEARYCVRLVGVTDVAGNPLVHSAIVVNGLVGDASGDLRVNVTDTGGLLSLVGTDPISLTDSQQIRCDIDHDGDIDETDLSMVIAAAGGDLRFAPDPCPIGAPQTLVSKRSGGTSGGTLRESGVPRGSVSSGRDASPLRRDDVANPSGEDAGEAADEVSGAERRTDRSTERSTMSTEKLAIHLAYPPRGDIGAERTELLSAIADILSVEVSEIEWCEDESGELWLVATRERAVEVGTHPCDRVALVASIADITPHSVLRFAVPVAEELPPYSARTSSFTLMTDPALSQEEVVHLLDRADARLVLEWTETPGVHWVRSDLVDGCVVLDAVAWLASQPQVQDIEPVVVYLECAAEQAPASNGGGERQEVETAPKTQQRR